MFSGIIQAVGTIEKIDDREIDKRLSIDVGSLDLSDLKIGDSIAVNGVCLSMIETIKTQFVADISTETLSCTTLGEMDVGSHVNLEKALRLSDRINGHLVSGHVDGVGIVQQRVADGRSERYIIETPETLSRYICKKGSICIDGISLTVNDVNESTFSVNIIPHTLQATTLGDCVAGKHVNLEVDIIARYLDSLVGKRK